MSDKVQDQMFGAWLKEQRNLKNVSLEEIAAVTKVHIAQLKMIEEDRWSELPAPAFVRGFLICYSTHLGLDEDEILRRYKAVMGKGIRTIESALPEGNKSVHSASRPKVRVASTPNFKVSPGASEMNFDERSMMTPKKIGIFSVVLGLIVVLAVLVSLGRKTEAPTETAPVAATPSESSPDATPSENPTPNVVTQTPPTKEPVASEPPPVAAPNTLELIGTEESWVIVKNGEGPSEGFSLKPKEKRSFSISPRAQLVLSNAGAVEIRWNGVLYEAPGFRGDVKRLRLPDQLDSLKEKKKIFVPRPVIAPRNTAPTTPPPESLPGQETPPPPAETVAPEAAQ